MIKNNRFFVAPQKNSDNFKVLFSRLASEGAGRPVDRHGFVDGPWTPESLSEAISTLDGNERGIELRAVQVWFQDNYNGISDANIQWLARIFGCNDPEATSQWQAQIRASKDRLTKERRERRKNEALSSQVSNYSLAFPASADPFVAGAARRITARESAQPSQLGTAAPLLASVRKAKPSRSNLARRTEALFGSDSTLTLPLVVFTGACALALIAFSLNVHSVIYSPSEGLSRQVGFLWAPNWTIVFIAILPMLLSLQIELMHCWSTEWRPELLSLMRRSTVIRTWDRGLTKATYSFWVTFIVTVIVASGYNWIATHLLPLLQADPGRWPMDWGRIAIVRPEIVSIPAAIVFSGFVFLYNGFTAYLFFAGHIFLHLMKSDFALIMRSFDLGDARRSFYEISQIAERLMNGIFRCTALGMAITLMMKLQSSFLQSDTTNILEWMIGDGLRFTGGSPGVDGGLGGEIAAPGHIYSLLCVLAIVGTFVNAQVTIRTQLPRLQEHADVRWSSLWTSMNICMALLVTSYFAIGFLPGFTLLVILSLLTTVYLVSKPYKRETCVIA